MGAFKNTKLHTEDRKPVGKITELKLIEFKIGAVACMTRVTRDWTPPVGWACCLSKHGMSLFQACLPMGYVYLNTKKNNSIYELSLL